MLSGTRRCYSASPSSLCPANSNQPFHHKGMYYPQPLPVPPAILIKYIQDLVRIKSTVTNTVNLQSGVNIPTPTYSAEFERTIPPIVIATPTTTQLEVIITTATPQLVGVTQPRQQSNTIGIGIGVGIGIAVLLGVLVTALVVGSICFIKKRERNQCKYILTMFHYVILCNSLQFSNKLRLIQSRCLPQPSHLLTDHHHCFREMHRESRLN